MLFSGDGYYWHPVLEVRLVAALLTVAKKVMVSVCMAFLLFARSLGTHTQRAQRCAAPESLHRSHCQEKMFLEVRPAAYEGGGVQHPKGTEREF